MRGVLSAFHPSFERILVIESGPRKVADTFLQHLYQIQKSEQVDLLTCYPGAPKSFNPQRGGVYSVHHPDAKTDRSLFIRRLLAKHYTVVAILCTGDSVLTKWKWVIALRTRAKVLVVNEFDGFFLIDRKHLRPAKMMLWIRLGLNQPLKLHLLGELLLVPFTIGYLALYAGWVHARRVVRRR
jgi:hypothetical protein